MSPVPTEPRGLVGFVVPAYANPSDVYIDPVNGTDSATSNGLLPSQAYKTWRRFVQTIIVAPGLNPSEGVPSLVLTSPMTIHFLSSQPDNTDPVNLIPILDGGSLSIVGAPSTVWIGTLGTLPGPTSTTVGATPQSIGALVWAASNGGTGLGTSGSDATKYLKSDGAGGFVMGNALAPVKQTSTSSTFTLTSSYVTKLGWTISVPAGQTVRLVALAQFEQTTSATFDIAKVHILNGATVIGQPGQVYVDGTGNGFGQAMSIVYDIPNAGPGAANVTYSLEVAAVNGGQHVVMLNASLEAMFVAQSL